MEIKDIIQKILPRLKEFLTQNAILHNEVINNIKAIKSRTINNESINEKDFEDFITGEGIASINQTISGLDKINPWTNEKYSKEFFAKWKDIYLKIDKISANKLLQDQEKAKVLYQEIGKLTPTGKVNNIVNRVIASLKIDCMTTICNFTDLRSVLEYIGIKFGWGYTNENSWLYGNLLLYSKIKESISCLDEETQKYFENNKKYIPWIGWQLVEYVRNNKMVEYKNMLEVNKNLILTGAPGTGKTYLAHEIAAGILGKSSWEEVENDKTLSLHVGFVQFHPSYDYSDFVEGLRPIENGTTVGFKRMDGVFKDFCKQALLTQSDKGENPKYVFIIDEINRGEMSKIFGELFFSIDPGYRGTKGAVQTQYANMELKGNGFDEVLNNGKKGQFFVPKNVYIIGTMNDIDRSVESMDFAMRRRFAFKEVTATSRIDMWDGNIDDTWKNVALSKMNAMNAVIEQIPGLNAAYHIGPSYFMKIQDMNGNWDELWNSNLKGLVAEYLRGMPDANDRLKEVWDAYDKA